MHYRFPPRLSLLIIGVLVLVAALPSPGAAQVAPTLTLEPGGGPCAANNPPLAVLGSGFPAGIAVTVLSRRASDGPSIPRPLIGTATVANDGTFRVQGQLGGCSPETPGGTQFVVSALHDPQPANGGPRPTLAEAAYTTSSAPTAAAPPTAPALPRLPSTGGGGTRPRTTPDDGRSFGGGVFAVLGGGLLGYGRLRRRMR